MPTDPHAAASTAAARSSSSKMQKLLKSAFKSPSAAVGEEAAADFRLSPSAPGRTPSGRRRSDDVGDRSSRDRESVGELDGSSKEVAALLRDAKIQWAYEAFPFEEKMESLLPVSSSSSRFLSLLLLPRATDAGRYKSLEDTLARADAWLCSSCASGVPIRLASVQTEALLTKISGESKNASDHVSSNASLYGLEDYHGVDIGVLRAVRLWYVAEAESSEIAVEIGLRAGDTRLGFAISRTEEGFIHVSSVAEEAGTPGARSGLLELHGAARRAARLLVVSRVGGEKVLPWMVSAAGGVRCYDTVSLSRKLSLHRHALRPITMHFLAWDRAHDVRIDSPPAVLMPMPPPPQEDEDVDGPSGVVGGKQGSSFTFQNIGLLPDSWL